MFSGFYTTNKGKAYIAKAVEGKTLVLTKGQYGNGTIPDGQSVMSVTALVSPLADMPISKISSQENVVTVTTQFSNRVNGVVIEPFHLMEAGIFGKVLNEDGTEDEDAPETLLYYANALTAEKADYITGILTEFIINWPLTISESANVTAIIDESLVYPTWKEFYELVGRRVTAEGTGDKLIINLEDVELTHLLLLSVLLTEDLKADATISYNGGKEYPIYNSNGTPVTEGQQIAGTIMNVVFHEDAGRWYILGGSAVRVATVLEALEGIDDTTMMTPKKVAIYFEKKALEVLGDLNTLLDEINGEYEEYILGDINSKLDEINGRVV